MKRNKMLVLLSTITSATILVARQNTKTQTQAEAISKVQSQQIVLNVLKLLLRRKLIDFY